MKKGHHLRFLGILIAFLFISAVVLPMKQVQAASGWRQDARGWWYQNADGSYPVNCWQMIGGQWYYFTGNGYMDYSEYRDGCWLNSSGVWDRSYSNGHWERNYSGIWYEDNGWYPRDQWLWIDGSYYYFNASGYMESNAYRDGRWLTASGAWNPAYRNGTWNSNDHGSWYEDNGWYPKNQVLMIDGQNYVFDSNGYMDINATRALDSGEDYYKGEIPVTEYSYEIIPLLPPFNDYYYVKTDNPDPESFEFADTSSKYIEDGGEAVFSSAGYFADVDYENKETLRVHGGYIFSSYGTDGGNVVLRALKPYSQKHAQDVLHTDHDYTETYYKYEDDCYENTAVVVNVPPSEDIVDYLIENYAKSSDFFTNMDSIQKALESLSIYYRAYVLGDLNFDEKHPYWGITTQYHTDLSLTIVSPYYNSSKKNLLTGSLYPFSFCAKIT